MLELQKLVGEFLAERPTMAKNNTPREVFDLLREEINEAEAEIENPEAMASELADILFFTMTIANIYGIDLEQAISISF